MKKASWIVMLLVLAARNLWGYCHCTEDLFPRPAYHLGYVDGQGHLILWREIADVVINDDIKLPLRVNYSVDNGDGPTLGYGWTVPLLESTAIPQSESCVEMVSPGGAHVYLMRQKDDRTSYVSSDQKWSGILTKEGNLTVTGPHMWVFSYVQGKLQQIKTGDGDILTWQYNGDRPVSISKVGGGTKLSVEYSPGSRQPVAFIINSQRYALTYGKIPMVSINKGIPMVQGFQSTLESITKPDKSKATFDFDFIPEGKYRLTHGDFAGKQRVFTWDPATKQLLSDGAYTYKTAPRGNTQVVSRIDGGGKAESLYYDGGLAAMVYQGFDGVTTRKHYMMAAGANYRHLRKVESLVKDKWVTSVLNSYDEQGRLIRSIMGDETLLETWWPNGKMASITREKAGKLVFQRNFSQAGQLTEYKFGDNIVKYAYDGKVRVLQRYLNGKLFSTVVDKGDLQHSLVVAADAAGKPDAQAKGMLPGEIVSDADAKAALDLVRKVNIINAAREKNSPQPGAK